MGFVIDCPFMDEKVRQIIMKDKKIQFIRWNVFKILFILRWVIRFPLSLNFFTEPIHEPELQNSAALF